MCSRYIALEDQLASQQAANQQLQHELQLRPTAAQLLELQQQIRALQAVGYGSVDDDPSDVHNTAVAADHTVETAAGSSLSEGVTPTGPAAAAVRSLSISSSSGLNIESMLLSKNRRLEHDVTMARLAVAEASQQLEAAREQVGPAVTSKQKCHLCALDYLLYCNGRGHVAMFAMCVMSVVLSPESTKRQNLL